MSSRISEMLLEPRKIQKYGNTTVLTDQPPEDSLAKAQPANFLIASCSARTLSLARKSVTGCDPRKQLQQASRSTLLRLTAFKKMCSQTINVVVSC